ncbi:PaaX family transcriptional regulator [Streptomyces sp. C]|nr:PaaX family transcriptional regulator [Streptomyces sp. C]
MTRRQNWTFLTNHARVLVTIARDPAARLRDVALVCALTERTVQAIVADLETDGYLRRARDGRRNRYEISPGAMFRHPAEAGVEVAGLLALLTGAPPSGGREGSEGPENADATAGFEPEPGPGGGDQAWPVGAAPAARASRP